MVCIYCDSDTKVINSRLQKRSNQVWRRRQCLVCSSVFTTHEQIEYSSALSVSNNGGVEPFSPGLLRQELYQALSHRKDAYAASEELLGTVIRNLLKLPDSPLFSPSDVTSSVSKVLKRFDRRAYLRYQADHPSLH